MYLFRAHKIAYVLVAAACAATAVVLREQLLLSLDGVLRVALRVPKPEPLAVVLREQLGLHAVDDIEVLRASDFASAKATVVQQHLFEA